MPRTEPITIVAGFAAAPVTTTYGVVQEVLLAAASAREVTPQELRLLLAIAERGGNVEGASHTLVGLLGSNSTAIRRAAVALAHEGLLTNTSRRGIGMRLTLTAAGRELAATMLEEIRERLNATTVAA